MPPSDTPRRSSPRRALLRLLRAIAIGGAILLLLVLLGLHTAPVKRYVLSQVTSALADAQIEFSAQRLDYNLLDLSLVLDDVTLRARDAGDLPPFAQIARATVDLSLLALLRGEYVVEEGTLTTPVVHVLVDAAGRDNLPRLPDRDTDDREPIDYLIRHFSISDALVRFEDRRQQLDIVMPIPSIDIEGQQISQHRVRLAASNGEMRLQDRRAGIERASGDFLVDRDAITVERLEIGGTGASITMSGNAVRFEDPRYDLSLSADLDVEQLATVAGLSEPVGGLLSADVTARGPLATMTARVAVRGKDLSFRGLEAVQLVAETSYDAAMQQARLDTVDITAPTGQIRAHGVIALDTRGGISQLDADVRTLDLDSITRALAVPYIAASRASGQVHARWPALEYQRATGDAQLALTPTRANPSRNVVPVGGTLIATADDRSVALDARDVRALSMTLGGRITLIDRRRLGGRIHVQARDLARVVPNVEAFLGRRPGALLGVPIAGGVRVDARLGGTITAPEADATVGAPDLGIGALSGVTLDAAARYSPTAVTLHRLDVAWQQARLQANGRLGLQGRQPIALNASLERTEIAALLAALGRSDIPAEGEVSLQANAAGSVRNPSGIVALRGSNLAAYGETLGTLTVDGELRNRDVQVKQLQLVKPQPDGDGTLTASGSYHLDRHSFTLEANSAQLRLLNLTLPNDMPLRGTLDIAARAEGTLENPTGTARLVTEALRLRDDDLGRLTIDANVAARQAHVQARADKFRINADARFGTTRPYQTDVSVLVDDLDVASVPLALEPPLTGHLRARLNGSGNLLEPADGSATATIDEMAITWNNQPIATDGPATIRYANQQLLIDRLSVRAQDSTLDVRGTLPVDVRSGEGVLTLDAQLDLPTLAAYAPQQYGVAARGRASLTGMVRGSMRAIVPDLTLALDDGFVTATGMEPGLSNVGVRMQLADAAFQVPMLRAEWGTARLDASARVPFDLLPDLPIDLPRQAGSAQLQAAVTHLELQTLPGAPDKLTGIVSLRADASAPRRDLAALSGRITFPELQLRFDDLTLDQEGTSTIAIENSEARVERFVLAGSAGHLALGGEVGLADPRLINLSAKGDFNIGALSVLTDAVRAEGAAVLELAATGTANTPSVRGFLELTDGNISVNEPEVAAEGLALRVDLSGQRATLTRLDGRVNGGTLSGSGSVEIGDGPVPDADLTLGFKDVALDAPLELRSLSDADVRITTRDEQIVVGGQVTIQEAGLTEDIDLDRGVFAMLTAPRSLDLTETRSAWLERVRLDLAIDTASPVVVDNNLAESEINASVRVLGNPYETGMSGRLTIEEGSELLLNERRYEVERGIITFIDDRRLVPSLDLLMRTAASRYDITLAVSGTPGDTTTTLTSDPTLPEPDILALLVTGRTLDEMRGEEFEVAQNQVMSYLAGRVGSRLGRGLERATGLTEVRLEPQLIASEADPTARLTLGQDLADNLRLVYSTDLKNSSDQIWITEYDVTRQFMSRAVRQADASYRFDFRHDVRFGGRPEPRRAKRRVLQTIASLAIDGETAMGEAAVRERFGLSPSEPYDFFRVRRGVRRLEERYRDQGWLESRVRVDRTVRGDAVDVVLRITLGRRVDIAFEGTVPPKKVQQQVREIWHRGVFDSQRTGDVLDAIRDWLVDQRHFDPTLDSAIVDTDPAARRVVFRIDPGRRFDAAELVFPGASGIDPSVLEEIVKEQKLEPKVFTAPGEVTDLLRRFYREQGYLSVEIDAPQYEFGSARARAIFSVREGAQFAIRHVSASGNRVIATSDLLADIPLVSSDPFFPVVAERSLTRIRELYWQHGYNDVKPEYQLALDRDAGVVDVTFVIAEGRRTVVADIQVVGNDETSERLIRRQLEIEPGTPLDLAALGRSRRNLYNTGAFAIAEITREEAKATVSAATGEDGGDGGDGQPEFAAGDIPARVNVAVREVQPFQLRYGLFYDTERGIGGILDVSNHNSLGKARELSLRTRYDSQLREARLSLSQPSLRDVPLAMIGTLFYREERNPATAESNAFNVDRVGVSIQQERQLRNRYVWNYGYRFEQAHTFDPRPEGRLNEFVNVSPLTSTFTRETRDEMLDASRGAFLSHAFSFSPEFLGSDVRYLKYFGQFFKYIPLEPEKRARFTNEILRPRLVYAAGVRVGLAQGLGGQELPLSERFFAGGSTTLRGFAQNALGPIGLDGIPLGGEAMLVINHEVRFPLRGIVDGVVFLDVGNVFVNVSDFSLRDLRESGGVGLRVRTPWFLVRLDYGVPFKRRAGETKSRFFFGIGQAF